jgi:DNA polymerase V
MNTNPLFSSSYKGSKNFTQENLRTANATGFNAAADDYAERGIDLNEQLVKNKPATFFMRVNGDAMIGAGIHNGDVVIVDRSLEAKNGKIIIAVINEEMLIRRIQIVSDKKIRLVPETSNLSPIEVDVAAANFYVWGVVTYVIHIV